MNVVEAPCYPPLMGVSLGTDRIGKSMAKWSSMANDCRMNASMVPITRQGSPETSTSRKVYGLMEASNGLINVKIPNCTWCPRRHTNCASVWGGYCKKKKGHKTKEFDPYNFESCLIVMTTINTSPSVRYMGRFTFKPLTTRMHPLASGPR